MLHNKTLSEHIKMHNLERESLMLEAVKASQWPEPENVISALYSFVQQSS